MNTEQTRRQATGEIDLRDLMAAIANGKWIILATTTLFAVLAVFYALSLPNIYKSEVTLAPASDSGGLNIPGQLGGLAALAGVNLGDKDGDKTALALEILKSREFLGRFIDQNDLYVSIMAAKGWDRASDKLLIDPKVYNEKTKEWVREVEEPFKPKPSLQETIEKFKKSLMINKDKSANIINVSFEHYSPILATKYLDRLVNAINEEMRMRDLEEANKSVDYLNKQISATNLSDIKTLLFSLVEEQTKTIMLANVREEYVFKTIDEAVVAEKKSKPNRILMIIIAVMLGAIMSSFLVMFRYLNSRSN